MNKQAFASIVMLFMLIAGGVPFYWLGYHPREIRKQCLELSLNAAFETLDNRDVAKERIGQAFRSQINLGDGANRAQRAAKNEALYMIMQQKEGYGICLELHGLKE